MLPWILKLNNYILKIFIDFKVKNKQKGGTQP